MVVIHVLSSIVLALVLGTTWMCIAIVARTTDTLFAPQAIRFFLSALTVGTFGVILAKRLPKMSLRLFHAAITVAALAYVLSPILCFQALRTLSSGFAALVYVSIPIWFLLLAYKQGYDHPFQHFLVVLGLGLVFYGVYPDNELRGNVWLPLVYLICGMLAFMAGSWVSRRLFWLHSAHDLNFWSMTFGAFANLLIAAVLGEWTKVQGWTPVFWGYLAYWGVLVTGVGAYFYRVRPGLAHVVVMTVLVPVTAMVLGYFLWQETPMSIPAGVGALIVLAVLVHNALLSVPSKWLCMYLSNDKRQGDRLVCLLPGTIDYAGQSIDIQITDIAFGGLGYRAESKIPEGSSVVIRLPMGHQNSLNLECTTVRCSEDPTSKQFSWKGGLQFKALSETRWQSLIEFLARVAQAEEV